jgi:hypothetical protein
MHRQRMRPSAAQFWLGSAPIIFPASGLMAAYAYLAMPVPRDGSEILQIWLQARPRSLT